ncbi:MAG: hypothetical protein ACQERL_09115 [Bacillota bacterium]
MNKKIWMIIFVLLLTLIGISGSVFAVIRVQPARIIINSLEENDRTGVIEVFNSGEEDLKITASLYDWSLNEEDNLLYFDPGETEYSLDGLIKFNPKEFMLPAGEKQIVRFTVNTAEEEEVIREKRGIVFFEHENDDINAEMGSRIITQIGTVIYQVPAGVKYNFKFTGLRVYKSPEPEPQGLVIRLENNGEAHIRYYPEYKIVDSENKVVMENNFNELVILPGDQRQISFRLEERLEPGDYKVLLEFDLFNINKNPEYQIPITIE